MSGCVDLIEKTCTNCGETFPLSGFYRNSKAADGHHWWCKTCQRAGVDAAAARRRAGMGEDAWRAQERSRVAASRAKNPGKGRAYNQAATKATAALRERHRSEYEHLLLLARRGELEAATP